ncbi:NSS family neurotransmitter:Na+ symporter [Hoyosella altamirensis]|uniref:NSS family neurotransmitter:Na+ symporter n=2 Tax=Hoyosella altamirensis TaxID=616997 RepID=A0A839RPT6_9ACTN|nr:NSS family neurotransmitter:Na+ symporter [Hoyosella altamirensis]
MPPTGMQQTRTAEQPDREAWSCRSVFILAAIGSAVGLGNIWRFPYVAYENGAGAFIIPYLFALLTAGIPLLFLDYAIGHKFRASAPLAFRRLHKRAEFIGWWQVGICFVIAAYYAVIVAWAVRYTFFSITKAWGDDPEGFLFTDFLRQQEGAEVGTSLVPGVALPLILIWLAVLIALGLGIQRGIGRANRVFVPLLIVTFIALVGRALFLPGSIAGLNAFFTPDWAVLREPTVWIAAYGHIFFSVSVAFGIMVTYSSYLKRKTNLTGSGLVVGFANSGFEILAGVGVFAALGYMATLASVPVDEVVSGGIGLAFIAFPQIISAMPGGAFFGVLFFGCLVFAGYTSLISLVQVVVAAVQEKLGISRVAAVVAVGTPMALVSLAFFPTTTGVNVLDVVDKFTNNLGIVGVALVSVVTLSWLLRRLPELQAHLNSVSTFKLGTPWIICVSVLTPAVIGTMLVTELNTLLRDGYSGLPGGFVGTFGWALQAALVILAIIAATLPCRAQQTGFLPTAPSQIGVRP